mgnify:CR=1 FL=1
MNIFCSSPDPFESAKFLDNKRVVKMVLETCQLLSTAINLSGGQGPYRSTHMNHPCSIWTRQSKHNYNWLVKHFDALLNEYTRRYGRVHKCRQYLRELYEGVQFIPHGPFTPFPNCTTFKQVDNVYEAYRLYLNEKWQNDKLKPKWS